MDFSLVIIVSGGSVFENRNGEDSFLNEIILFLFSLPSKCCFIFSQKSKKNSGTAIQYFFLLNFMFRISLSEFPSYNSCLLKIDE